MVEAQAVVDIRSHRLRQLFEQEEIEALSILRTVLGRQLRRPRHPTPARLTSLAYMWKRA